MFVVHCQDKAGAEEVRLANRGAHLEFLNANRDKIVMAGPVLTEDLQGMVGSVLVVDVPDREALNLFLAADPYAKAGLFQIVTVLPYKKVMP